MIVTETTLVGFTLINGTWGTQMALFIAALFNYFTNPNPNIPKADDISEETYLQEM
jgi:hypothetical protein